MNIVFLDFGKAFVIVPCRIFTEKLLRYEIGDQTMRWIQNWLNGWTQRVLISKERSFTWRPVTSEVTPGVSLV